MTKLSSIPQHHMSITCGLCKHHSMLEVARQVGLSKFAVSRILKDIDAAYEKLARWEKLE